MSTDVKVKPVPSVITGNNARLIAEVAKLWFKPTDVILDPTYGRGKWWSEYDHPGRLILHDWRIDRVDFRCLPEADESVDVVAFDPPYVAKGGRETSGISDMDDRFGLADAGRTPVAVQDIIDSGIKEASRVLKPCGLLLVKCTDYISSGHFWLGHHFTVAAALSFGLEQVDEFVHCSGTGPQPTHNRDGSKRRQVHSRRAHSFLCVFQSLP